MGKFLGNIVINNFCMKLFFRKLDKLAAINKAKVSKLQFSESLKMA